MPFLLAILFLFVIISGFIITSYYNKKTPIPESFEEKYQEAQNCTICGMRKSCTINKIAEIIKEKE